MQRIQDNSMQINFVDIDGAEASIDSKLSIPQMLELRHEGVTWYATSGDTICLRAGLSYVQMERMRRAPIWRDHVKEFLTYKGLELSDANFKKYGCMPPKRKSQPQKGARGISNRHTESELERFREFSREFASEGNSDASGGRIFATVTRTAFDPETDQECEIELPSGEAVQAALLEFPYPERGMSSMDAANQLAEYFSLTNRQRNVLVSARTRYAVFSHLVNVEANNLVKSGQLVKPRRGWFAKPEQIREESESDTAPSIAAVAASDYIPVEDNLAQAAEESIETNYQQIQDALTADLLQRIQDNSPDFFEELVIDLLVAMGYGGSREEAGRAVGGSGDGGIDGVINEDILGLDVIYVQAKRWQADVGEPPVRDFVGALSGRRARKGIFITTSAFSNRAKEYVSSIDSRDTKIVLIDGHQLAQFMIDYNVGVSVTKSYEIKRVDSDYFAEEGE